MLQYVAVGTYNSVINLQVWSFLLKPEIKSVLKLYVFQELD